jgi:PleD family two-component response regulator
MPQSPNSNASEHRNNVRASGKASLSRLHDMSVRWHTVLVETAPRATCGVVTSRAWQLTARTRNLNDCPMITLGLSPALSKTMTTRILLVDDDEIVLDYLRMLVSPEGYGVMTAVNAQAALVAMQQDFAEIVIIDVTMPNMSGLALCREIRRQTYSGCVYLILHSAKDTDEDILEGMDAGADDYISKGISKVQLFGRLRTAQRILTLEGKGKSLREREQQAPTTDALSAPIFG